MTTKRSKMPGSEPDYINAGKNGDNLCVQKQNPLLSLSKTELTLTEFKILDAYLGRINMYDESKRVVMFEKGCLENLMGVDRIRKEDLELRLKHLFQVVKIEDESTPKGFKLVSLFEEADVTQDEYGTWQVRLECSTKARKYFFNNENVNYLKYTLKNIVNLKSRYSYVLYLYLRNNRYRTPFEVSFAELKEVLNCNSDTYSTFYRFNDLVLKKAYAEVNEKTDLHFTYESIKKGRSVVAVRFTIETMQKLEDKTVVKEIPKEHLKLKEAQKEIWESNIEEFQFNQEQIEELRALLAVVPVSKMPHTPESLGIGESLDIRRYHYMAAKVASMNTNDKINPIKSKFLYLKKILERDSKS